MVRTAYPLVSIVLAVYNPDPAHFEKLLRSLENQSYPEIELVVFDDSGSDEAFQSTKEYISSYIQNIPCKIHRNPSNIGSIGTFNEAMRYANGEYVAFCDQDDIWHKEKIGKLVEEIECTGALLCYSDMEIINEAGKVVQPGVAKRSLLLKPVYGEGLFPFFIHQNVISGCSMLVRSSLARKARPYPAIGYHHDHWIALFAAYYGKIAYIQQALVQYRIHGQNQIGLSVLRNVWTRDDYEVHLVRKKEQFAQLLQRFPEARDILECESDFLAERLEAFHRRSWPDLLRLAWSHRALRYRLLFESLVCIVPSRWAEVLIGFVKKRNSSQSWGENR